MAQACKRCGEESVVASRDEPFCKRCFNRFVQYRQKKQMDGFKVDFKTDRVKNVLLALSLGPASVALLDCCVDTLRTQASSYNGKQGFKLVCLVVDETPVKGETDRDIKETVQKLKEKYPEVDFEVVKLDPSKLDEAAAGDNDETIAVTEGKEVNSVSEAVGKMNRTSRQDTISALKNQIISNYAKQHKKYEFDITIYGHCQTRLAEMVIALTAKGRGTSIPHFVDGYTYPMREVLGAEIAIYNQLNGLDQYVVTYTARVPGTTKLQSIDELVNQYFKSVEIGFPSVVSTVVRTASKLAPGEVSKTCAVCGGPMEPDTLDWIKKITVSPPTEDQSTCLCYGCVVMFRNSVDSVKWPRHSKHDVLKEYEL